MDQEGENDHLMKTVMRALNSAEEKVLPITQVGSSVGSITCLTRRLFSDTVSRALELVQVSIFRFYLLSGEMERTIFIFFVFCSLGRLPPPRPLAWIFIGRIDFPEEPTRLRTLAYSARRQMKISHPKKTLQVSVLYRVNMCNSQRRNGHNAEKPSGHVPRYMVWLLNGTVFCSKVQ